MDTFFSFMNGFEDLLWGYAGFPLLAALGLYLSIQSNFVQIFKFPTVLRTFFGFFKVHEEKVGGVHPLKAFFACVGGCVGVGNVVAICSAVQIGGPGALLWIWITAFIGMTVKYAEVYLGVRYRVPNDQGGFDGGPMYFVQRVVKARWVPIAICLLLCVYGVEVYQFSVVASSVSENFGLNKIFVVGTLLVLVLFAGAGGVRRVGNISSAVIPIFIVLYVGMCSWVFIQNYSMIPDVLYNVFATAFSGHSAVGGFVGSTLMMTISQGVRRSCYTGDLGIGYAAVIHSESCARIPEKQASLVFFDIFIDTFMICTSSVLIILITDTWHQQLPTSMLVQTALGQYFPYMHYFMPFFLFLLGYSTINAYLCVGLKSAQYISPKYGKPVYYLYTVAAFLFFAVVDSTQAQSAMAIAGGLLLVINCYSIFKLRHEISFDIGDHEPADETTGESTTPACNIA